MREHLTLRPPGGLWFRSVALPERRADRSVYEMWLRKLVLQTLGRSSAQEPLVFLDPRRALSDSRLPEAWLKATHTALRDGIRQFYASRRLEVSARRIEQELCLE